MNPPFDNLWVKIAAVVLAILLWFHVVTEKVYQNEYVLELQNVELTGELVLIENPPDSIVVSVSATGKNLLRTDWKKRGLKLVANRSLPGRFKIDLSADNVSLVKAEGVELIEVLSPREVMLNADRVTTKQVPVTSNIIIETADGYAVARRDSLSPSVVTVRGPRSVLDTLLYIETSATEFTRVRNDFTGSIPLHYPDIYGLTIYPDTVQTFVSVVPIMRKDFEDIEIRCLNAPESLGYRLEPATVDIRLSGKAEEVENVKAESISAIADYILISESDSIPIQVVLPPSVSLISKSSESTKIIIAQ